MEDIIVRIIDLTVPGVTVLDEDGNYNIYINARLSYEQQQQVYNHEMKHINLGHFYDSSPVADNERDAG
ncbi:hypothetical protein [uncultured Ruminococcus sp.]|uniref:hypothetical protein n=1 Tax=uncultured Ruminococcus sp. TaxID=165186 RepID=UPI00292D8D82|nr:hypothetical protein [uncultured Ruminococcus sp.]